LTRVKRRHLTTSQALLGSGEQRNRADFVWHLLQQRRCQKGVRVRESERKNKKA